MFILSILLFLISSKVSGQNTNTGAGYNSTFDSLQLVIKKDKPDTNKVNHLLLLTDALKKTGDVENGLKYAAEALTLSEKLNFKHGSAKLNVKMGELCFLQSNFKSALDYYYKALELYEALEMKEETAFCFLKIGVTHTTQSEHTLALSQLHKALEINEEIKNRAGEANCLKSIGNVYIYQGDHSSALTYYLASLKVYEELNDETGISSCLLNIGTIYLYEANNTKALDYYFRALKMLRRSDNKASQVIALTNIGLIYLTQNDFSSALDNFFKAQELAEELKSKDKLVIIYNSIGSCLVKQKHYTKALSYLNKTLALANEIGDKTIAASSYSSIADIYCASGNFKKAEQHIILAIGIADSIGATRLLPDYERFLSEIYDTTKQYEKALIHYKKYAALKDTLFSQENKKELVQKELTYEFEKKEGILKAENEKQQALAEQKNIIIWVITAGLLLVFIFAALVLRSLRITRKQKNIIEQQSSEVSRQKEIADSQRILAEELRAIAEKQKNVAQEKQKEVVASITYAKRIQTALLTSNEYIKEHLPAEHFILFKPKDIVSGDFYWALNTTQLPGWDLGTNTIKRTATFNRRNTFYLITADCTGHGVPGAFMSMLNISYLNENVIERNIRLPHDILNAQRKEIIQALNPHGSTEESKDGMDCVLCVYDFEKMLLHFASANNPLWLVRNGQLTEYKGDKMPVGKYDEVIKPFTLQTIELQKGDIIYTSTDGFADQFGINGKKLMKKRFKEELLKTHHLPMHEQKKHLDQFFETWKGNTEQVDDVCVIGVKI